MVSEAFVDSSGFYAGLFPRDRCHDEAVEYFDNPEPLTRLVTTDYVLDETVTLLKSRRQSHLVEPWLGQVLTSPRYDIIWMDRDRFFEVRRFCAKHDDKEWSFTDCFSFCVMHERKIQQALTSDHDFRQAGFELLLTDR